MISVRDKVNQDDEAVFRTLANEKLMSSISNAVSLLTNRKQKLQEDNTIEKYYPEASKANTLTTRYKRILNGNLN